jgi:hypothetical protein
MSFKGKFTRIQEGFSSNRRMPRLGKIRLGVKVENTQGKTYPKEVDYFVVPDEVRRVYGDHPKELDVMLMSDDAEVIFPQKLARYGSSKGLTCHGNGVEAERLNEQTKQWEPRKCPCEFRKTQENPKGDCTETAHLMVLLPQVNLGGNYQLTTRSYNSTVDVNSGLDYIRALVGRICMVPLKLRRQKIETHHDGKKQAHYTLTLSLDATVDGINQLRENTTKVLSSAHFQIEGPVEENPATDPPDVIEAEGTEVEEDDAQPAQVTKEPTKAEPVVASTAPWPKREPTTNHVLAQEKKPDPPAQTTQEQTIDAQAPPKAEPAPKSVQNEDPPFLTGTLLSSFKRKNSKGTFYYEIHIVSNGVELEYVTMQPSTHFGVDFYDDLCNETVRFAWKPVGKARELHYLEREPAAAPS